MHFSLLSKLLLRGILLFSFSFPLMHTFATPTDHTTKLIQDTRPIVDVLKELSDTYQVFFTYDYELLEDVKVSFTLKQGESLQIAMTRLLKDSGFGYEHVNQRFFVVYKMGKKGKKGVKRVLKKIEQIENLEEKMGVKVMRELKPRKVMSYISAEKDFPVKGQVKAETGEPLIGATVRVKGGKQGALTDKEGRFSIDLPDGNQTLIVSYIGYKPVEIDVNGQSEINISLNLDDNSLEEVIVVGYGTVRKRDLTGAVSRIEGKELTNLPSPRADQLLQGRLTGVNVTSVNGAPGARTTIRIRGGNSIQGDNEPLYVIDGFIAGTDFNLNDINVNDIQSIEVLKDASAISIYGTRGANGVIIITTKDGNGVTPGKPSVSVNAYTGFQNILRKIDFLDGAQRAQWGSDYAVYSGESNPFTDPTLLADTDWQDVISRTAPMSNIDFSIRGRNERNSYYFSANYLNQRGILKNSGIERYNVRANLDFQLAKWIKFGTRLNTTIQDSDNDLTSYFEVQEALTTFPRFKPDGTFWDDNYVQGAPFANPEARISLNINETKSSSILGNFFLELEPIEGLKFRSTLAPQVRWVKNNRFQSGLLPTRAAARTGGGAFIGNSYNVQLLQENTLSYAKELNENNRFDVLAGFTWQTSRTEAFSAETQGVPNDAASFDILGLGSQETNRVRSSFPNPFQLVSWIARANYTLNNKYLLTIAGRVDGSSVFATSNNKYAFFPSAAVAWRLIEEPFIKNLNVFSNLKLRASYGQSGSQAIGALSTLATYGVGNVPIFNNTVQSVVRLQRPSNPELKWETTDQIDIGLEMGFFNGRLEMEIDYYYKKTNDLLLNRQIPGQTGFGSRLENVGSLQNQGLELMINSVNIATPDFEWSTTLTLSGNRSEVLDLGGVDQITLLNNFGGIGNAATLIVGEPVAVFTGLEYVGTWRDQETLDSEGYTGVPARVGGPRFRDVNNDGTVSLADDFQIIGNPEPDFYGGLNNSFRYKNFTMDVMIQGTFGNDVYNQAALYGFFGRNTHNVYTSALDRWTPNNTDSRVPAAGSVQGIFDVPSNDEMVEDGTHLRIKNVRLGYTFNTESIDWLEGLNVYAAGTNLLLFSDFRAFDPEALDGFGGSNGEFVNILRGFTSMNYPSARTITFGLTANF